MPETDSRLKLWRNTIQLFHDYVSIGFRGPFKACGLERYILEPILKDSNGKDQNPDLVAADNQGRYVVVELTMNTESKLHKLIEYQSIDGRYLADYGLRATTSRPDIMTSRLQDFDDGPYCRIIVDPILIVHNEDLLTNSTLSNELAKAKNTNMSRLPDLPITLLVESKGREIRRGILEQIMQLFSPDSKGTTAREMVEIALERIADRVRVQKKEELISKVRKEMDDLVRNELSRYLESVDGTYRARVGLRSEHHATRQRVGAILKAWASEQKPVYHPSLDTY